MNLLTWYAIIMLEIATIENPTNSRKTVRKYKMVLKFDRKTNVI